MLSEVAADRLPVAAGRHSGWGLQGKGSGAVRQTWALGMPLPGASPSPLCPSGFSSQWGLLARRVGGAVQMQGPLQTWAR